MRVGCRPPELWVPALGGEPGPAAAEERHTRPMEVRSSKLHGAPAGLRHRLPSEWAAEPTQTATVSSAKSIYAP